MSRCCAPNGRSRPGGRDRDTVGTERTPAGLPVQAEPHPRDRTGIGVFGNELDRKLGRAATEEVTFDLDATESVVYGRREQGTGRSRSGYLAYNSYVVTWAQRIRAVTSNLKRATSPGSRPPSRSR
jgi:hypothetical protein